MKKTKKEWIPGIEGYQIELEDNETMKIFWNELNPKTASTIAYGNKNDKIFVVYTALKDGVERVSHITINDVMLFQVDFKIDVEE